MKKLCHSRLSYLIHEYIFYLITSALFASRYASLCTICMVMIVFYLVIVRFEGHKFWECCCRPHWETREREEKSTAKLTSTASIISYDISPQLEINSRLFLFLLDASTDSPKCDDNNRSLHHAIKIPYPAYFLSI